MLRTLTVAAGSAQVSDIVADLVVILVTAALVAMVMQRFRLQTIPAYLVSGAMLGLAGLVNQGESVQAIADLAIVLLLFGIGMHLDAGSLRVGLRQTLAASTLSVVTCVVVLWPLARGAVPGWHEALVVAMALALSSTAVVLRLLTDARELHRMHGRVSLAVLVVQDIVVIPMLLAIPLLAEAAGTRVPPDADTSGSGDLYVGTALSVLGVACITVVGLFALPRMLRAASKARSGGSEVMMILAVAYALGSAAMTQYLGLSPALGAFIAGFLLGQTEFHYHLVGQINTIRDLFLAVFFTAVGTKVDIVNLTGGDLTVIAVGFAALVVLKSVVIAVSCWASGLAPRLATRVGVGLAPAGEFGIVILGVAAAPDNQLLSPQSLSQGIAIIFLSMLVNPATVQLGRSLSERLPRVPPAPWIPHRATLGADLSQDSHRPFVIVAGFGVVGRAVFDQLSQLNVPASVIEMNTHTVATQRKQGRTILFGDVSDPEVLESAGIRDATALVLTIPDDQAVLRACRNAKRINPGVFIVARTTYLSKGMRAVSEGADKTVVEEIVTAEAMERLVELHCVLPNTPRDAGGPDAAGGDGATTDGTGGGSPA